MDEYRLTVKNGYWIKHDEAKTVDVVCYRAGCDCQKKHPLRIESKKSYGLHKGLPVPSNPYPHLKCN